MIQEYFIHNNVSDNGIIICAGVNEFNKEIFEVFTPKIVLKQFYYNCSKHFVVDRFLNLFNDVSGYIIFANGDNCYIYKFDTLFVKIKSINANLIKRQKKGGQSALRISRLTEESRHNYVISIIDSINLLCRDSQPWIFGSSEIVKMVFQRSELLVKLNNGGFLDFNSDTINNTNKWLQYLTTDTIDDTLLDEILLYLDTNPDMLDFNIDNKDKMKYYLTKDDLIKYNKSKYFERVRLFEYIGVKYYSFDNIDIGE